MKNRIVYLLFFLLLTICNSCNNDNNYYTDFNHIKTSELPEKYRDVIISSILDNRDKENYYCLDLERNCDSCSVKRDDEGMLGIVVGRKPHIIIENCKEEIEVPIDFGVDMVFVTNEALYIPETNYMDNPTYYDSIVKFDDFLFKEIKRK